MDRTTGAKHSWTPLLAIVAIRDNKEYMRVLYHYYRVVGPPKLLPQKMEFSKPRGPLKEYRGVLQAYTGLCRVCGAI